MKLAIVKWIVKKWLPGWKLIEPGYHRHKNPEQKKKVWFVRPITNKYIRREYE
jgi:hypothetical protein